jgi:hypothetical protein
MDNLLFDKKDVFSWSNCEDAKKYIGKEGYFSNYCLNNLVEWYRESLHEINLSTGGRITNLFITNEGESFGLFIPLDKVKKPENKWRAFKDLDDLKTYANKSVGCIVVYRKKDNDKTMATAVITNYIFSTNCICIGNRPFLFKTLFQEYELLNEHAIWQPFGVQE